MKIEINKKYKTRDECPTRIITTEASNNFSPVVFEVYRDGWWMVLAATPEGRHRTDGVEDRNDLIEVKEKKQLTGFVNVYQDDEEGPKFFYHKNEELAKEGQMGSNRTFITCIDLSQYGIFYEENEGL